MPSPHDCQTEPMTQFLAENINKQMIQNMKKLHQYLTEILGQEMTLEQMYHDLGDMMEKITTLIYIFQVLRVTREEYVCLKMILFLTEGELCVIVKNIF